MKRISADWLPSIPESHLCAVMLNYRYFVRRFPQWLALAVGNCGDEAVRQLLIPNLVEEAGTYGGAPSHLALLDSLIRSCRWSSNDFTPQPETCECEAWFFEVMHSAPTYQALAVLGPGTEDISQQFLQPLEVAVRKHHGSRADLSYFEAHRPEVEEHHGDDIRIALHLLGEQSNGGSKFREQIEDFAREAIERHQRFWDTMRSYAMEL